MAASDLQLNPKVSAKQSPARASSLRNLQNCKLVYTENSNANCDHKRLVRFATTLKNRITESTVDTYNTLARTEDSQDSGLLLMATAARQFRCSEKERQPPRSQLYQNEDKWV